MKTFGAERRGRRRAPVPRAAVERGVHRVGHPDPGAAREGGRGAPARAGVRGANSHAGKSADGREHLETYPQRRAVPHPGGRAGPGRDPGRAVQPVGRRQPPATFVRGETYGRDVAVLRPPAHATATARRCGSASREILRRGPTSAASSIEFDRAGERVAATARVHFVVHPPKPRAAPSRRSTPGRPRCVGCTEASRSWRDDFISAAVSEHGEGRGLAAGPQAWADAWPGRPTRRTSASARAALDVGRLEAIEVDEATGIGLATLSTRTLDPLGGGCSARRVAPQGVRRRRAGCR